MASRTKKKRGKRSSKKKLSDPTGKAFIKATFNNVLVTITDQNGNTIHGHQPVEKDSKDRERIPLMRLS